MVDYLCWLASVLAARSIPVDLAASLDLLGAFFAERMDAVDGPVVTAVLHAVRTEFAKAAATPVPRDDGAWPEADDLNLHYCWPSA